MRQIWRLENSQRPLRYADAMADNILIFGCMSEIVCFLAEFGVEAPTK